MYFIIEENKRNFTTKIGKVHWLDKAQESLPVYNNAY